MKYFKKTAMLTIVSPHLPKQLSKYPERKKLTKQINDFLRHSRSLHGENTALSTIEDFKPVLKDIDNKIKKIETDLIVARATHGYNSAEARYLEKSMERANSFKIKLGNKGETLYARHNKEKDALELSTAFQYESGDKFPHINNNDLFQ